MDNIDRKAADAVNRFADCGEIAVAFSGGRDSSCLLDMFYRFLPGHRIRAFHVNHGIRPEADADELAAAQFCKDRGIDFEAFKIDVPASLNGRSVETAAREMRREIYLSVANNGADKVALAHHAADRAESVLMHILRGSGVEGLVGMKFEDGFIIRPLLDFLPQELDEYVRLYDIKYVVDATNADTVYSRNYLRHKVFPLLEEKYSAIRTLNRLADNAADNISFVDKKLDFGSIKLSGGKVSLKEELLKEKYAAYRYAVYAINLLGQKKDYTSLHINGVLALADKPLGKRFSFLGITAVREYGAVTLYRQQEAFGGEIPCAFGETVVGGQFVKLELQESPEISYSQKGTDRKLYFDWDKLPPDAVIRFRRNGDVFKPFNCGEKKLKKFFTDKKIPLTERDSIPVIARGNTVFAVVGVEIGDLIKIDEHTAKVCAVWKDCGANAGKVE